MKIMVCGPIGFGGVEKIKHWYSVLHEKGYDIIDHIDEKNMNYSKINDFRNEISLSKQIISHDLNYVSKSDVILVLADGNPSYGTGIEMYVASKHNKHVILFCEKNLPTPWPIAFANNIVTSESELFSVLSKLKSSYDI